MSKYRIAPVTDNLQWNSFVESSPQGTVFSRSEYLDAVGRRSECLYIVKGDEVKAGLALIMSDDGTSVEFDDLVIYNGIMFAGQADDRKATKARLERFEITEFVIQYLTDAYRNVELALSPQFEDLRPFLWHNYHSPDPAEKYVADLRYTSYLDISVLENSLSAEDTSLFRNMETLRQRNIREAIQSGARVETSLSPDDFGKFYCLLMAAQGEDVSAGQIDRMKNLIGRLVDASLAEMFLVLDADGSLLYTTVFCFDSKRAYYLFGAGNLAVDARYKGTAAFWGAFKALARDKGIKCVDLEGVNSPRRGWFKLSFGGELHPYYHVNIRR